MDGVVRQAWQQGTRVWPMGFMGLARRMKPAGNVGHAAHARTRLEQRGRSRSTAGFTLVEMFVALAILAIMGTLIASAMVTASKAMESSTRASNAAVLEQSINTAVADVLRFASVHIDDGYQTEFVGPRFDSDSCTDVTGSVVRDGYLGVEEGKIMLVTPAGSVSIPRSAGIYTDFKVRDDSFVLTYHTETKLFTGTYTIEADGGAFQRECSFTCRSLVEGMPARNAEGQSGGQVVPGGTTPGGTTPAPGEGQPQGDDPSQGGGAPVQPEQPDDGSGSGDGSGSDGGTTPTDGGGGQTPPSGGGDDEEIIEIGDGPLFG